jgi:F-type H+-transporting ATPase subunit gamma
MKMVASAKLSGFQKYWFYTRENRCFLEKCFAQSCDEVDPSQYPSFARRPASPSSHHLVMVVGADRGLCGGYNTQLNRSLERLLREEKATGHHVQAIACGNRVISFLEKASITVVNGQAMGSGPSLPVARRLVDTLLDLWETGVYGKFSLVYTRFMNVMRQEVTVKPLLPLFPAPVSDFLKKDSLFPQGAWPLLEPTGPLVCETVGRMVLYGMVYEALLESFLSEQGARMTAMENATRNGKEALKKLNLLYNRKRQSLITNELIEVIAGANV